jgi:hypothetical protein
MLDVEEMETISALTSPHQDKVIEKILKSREERDPPWKRQRRARGPPFRRKFRERPIPAPTIAKARASLVENLHLPVVVVGVK